MCYNNTGPKIGWKGVYNFYSTLHSMAHIICKVKGKSGLLLIHILFIIVNNRDNIRTSFLQHFCSKINQIHL